MRFLSWFTYLPFIYPFWSAIIVNTIGTSWINCTMSSGPSFFKPKLCKSYFLLNFFHNEQLLLLSSFGAITFSQVLKSVSLLFAVIFKFPISVVRPFGFFIQTLKNYTSRIFFSFLVKAIFLGKKNNDLIFNTVISWTLMFQHSH